MSIELVAKTKTDLEAQGVLLVGTCGSLEILLRVAWAKRADGAKLIIKRPGQNGCTYKNGVRYSHDAMAFPTGWIDCLINAGPPLDENIPAWNPTGTDPHAELADPFDPDAGDEPGPGPEPPSPPDAILTRLDEIEAFLALRFDAQDEDFAAFREWAETLAGKVKAPPYSGTIAGKKVTLRPVTSKGKGSLAGA